jgi:hypothetical protein
MSDPVGLTSVHPTLLLVSLAQTIVLHDSEVILDLNPTFYYSLRPLLESI